MKPPLIRKAAQHIVSGASINNGIFCTCEKEVIVVEEVADTLIKFMQETGRVYLLNPEEVEKVTKLVVTPERKINGDLHWQERTSDSARRGNRGRRRVPSGHLRSSRDHPLVWLEQMMPVLPIVRVKDVNEGIEFARQGRAGKPSHRHHALESCGAHDGLRARRTDHDFREERTVVRRHRTRRRRAHLIHHRRSYRRRASHRREHLPGSVAAPWWSRSELSDVWNRSVR